MLSWVTHVDEEDDAAPTPELTADAKKQIAIIFKAYDKDGSGEITYKELRDSLPEGSFSTAEIKKMFAEYDEDGDHLITLNEFQKLMEATGAFYEEEGP